MGDNDPYLDFYETATRASPEALSRMFAAILAYFSQAVRVKCGAHFRRALLKESQKIRYATH